MDLCVTGAGLAMIEQAVVAWYSWLSTVSQTSVLHLQGWADAIRLPVATVLILGLIGATSPCQLTTNLGALAYASARPGRRAALTLALAYVAGKITVYTLAGGAIIALGLQLQSASVPVIIAVRKALGPLMLLIGASMFGLQLPRMSVGQRLAHRLRTDVPAAGVTGAYPLGVVFAFAFCPTLFWLFFGLTIPLALRSAGGWSFPGLFAFGASLPLLAAATAVAAGIGAIDTVAGNVRRLPRPLRVAAGILLVLAGIHDTVIYWML